MPQLRSCYFCGSVGDSLREYEVVPERLVASGESRSAVLCSDCREKLRRVLEPLVEAAESSGSGAPDHGTAAVGEVVFEDGDATADDEAATDGRDGGGDETVSVTERETDDENGADDGDEGEADDTDVPDGYHKVLRLLQNREFPMERADLTALVTGAYDVSEPQCERILETAIERGVLVEDGSTLDIGRN